MWRDPNDDGLGYSIAEKSRLQAANSKKKVHIKFGDDGSDNELDSVNDIEKKNFSYNKGERNKKNCSLKGKDDNLNRSKAFQSYNSRDEQKMHIALDNDDSDESIPSEMSNNEDQNSGSDSNEDQGSGSDSSDDQNIGSDSNEDQGSGNDSSDDQDGGSDAEGGTSVEEAEDYSQMSMEELLKLQDKIGTKAFREKVMKVEDSADKGSKTRKTYYKRLNKNRPSEMPLMRKTAKRMSFLDPYKKAKETILRDPRFDDLSGKLDLHRWDKRFAFLKEARKKELELLKKQYSKVTNAKKKKRMKLILQRMENQYQESLNREQEQAVKQLERKQQKEALREGKKPKFMSNKTKKTMLKAMHFEKLKKANKVDKYLERKEKRQLQKERKANW